MQSLLLALALSAPAAAAVPYQGVLLEFSATWCGPCQQMSPLVQRLERQGYPIRKVDVDREKALARKYHISSIPAFVLVVNGREVSRSVGAQSESALKRLMAQIPRKVPRRDAFVSAVRSGMDERPPVPSVASTAAVVLEDRPQRGILPRIKLPLFHSKSKPVRLGPQAETPAVFRGKYETPQQRGEQIARIDPMASSTRIRITDAQGINYGSGTIIESRPGKTVVLTCGHIFRNLSDKSSVEVDVFNGDQAETYVGKLLRYDLEADVGLITIASDVPLSKSHVAAADVRQLPNDRVFSIGCGGGDIPTRQNIRVTRLNPYLGPANLECTGVPVQGRSGGGLFNQKGEIVGVCVAADPKRRCGLYAGLKAIHALLNQDGAATPAAGLGNVARQDALNDTVTGPRDVDSVELMAAESFAPTDGADGDNATVDTVSRDTELTAAAATRSLAAVPHTMNGAEVICIIRSIDNPRATSRVVIINRASPKFLSYLRGELEQQPQPTVARMGPSGDEPTTTRRLAGPTDPNGRTTTPAAHRSRQTPRETIDPSEKIMPRWRVATRRQPPSPAAPRFAAPQRYRRSTESRR